MIGHSPPRACISHGVHTRLRQLCLSNIKHIYTNLPPDRLRWPPTARARDLIELQVFARRKEDPMYAPAGVKTNADYPIPDTMKAWVLGDPGQLSLTDKPVPVPKLSLIHI